MRLRKCEDSHGQHVTCMTCNATTPLASAYADLDGTPFRAYHCKACAVQKAALDWLRAQNVKAPDFVWVEDLSAVLADMFTAGEVYGALTQLELAGAVQIDGKRRDEDPTVTLIHQRKET